MNVGLPGTGIGGLFYLLTALLMPVMEMAHTLRGRSSLHRWRIVVFQTALAVGVIAGLWGTAWMLHHLLPPAVSTSVQAVHARVTSTLGATPTVFTCSTLAGILLGVELLRPLASRGSNPSKSLQS